MILNMNMVFLLLWLKKLYVELWKKKKIIGGHYIILRVVEEKRRKLLENEHQMGLIST